MNRPAESSSRAPRTAAYARYAEVYDRIGQREFGRKIAEATLAYLHSCGAHPASALDLACGTGAATTILAAAVPRVIGCDISEAMLTVARAAAAGSGLPIEWRLQDMRDVVLEQPVDLVTCFYDAINYLVQDNDVHATFARAYDALRPGGHFVFDLNTREKFSTAWNESCFVAVDRDDLFGIYQSWFEAGTDLSPLILTFFVRVSDGNWERFDEEHVERAYPLAGISSMLEQAGLEVAAMFDYPDGFTRFGGPGSERSHRVVFVAKRPEAGA